MTGRTRSWGALLGASVVVGLAAGLAGMALTLLLHAVQHLAFGYTENTFLVGVERAAPLRRVLALTLGGLVVAVGWWLLRRRTTPEDVSVTHALRESGHRLRVRPAVADAVLQVVAVGAGASLGREGAPRLAGAALADWISRRLGLDDSQRRILLACGAGAGLAAVYNVPLAGAVFTLEVLLVSARPRDVVAALLTSGVATVTAWPVVGDRSTYVVGALPFAWPVLVAALLLGPVLGVLGVGFTLFSRWCRTHAPTGGWAVPAIVLGFAALGALAIAFPQLLGNGKGPAELAFTGELGVGLALAVAVLKPLATGACLATGAIGGLMTPALATGAALGEVAGHLVGPLWSGGTIGGFALVGASALLAVTQRAALVGLVFPVELLHAGTALLPATAVAIAGAIVVARALDPGAVRPPARSGALGGPLAAWHSGRHGRPAER